VRRIARYLMPLLAVLAPVASAAQSRPPLVLAAASLQESMTAAAGAWARQGHAKPVISFAASSVLARQAEAGGQADLFASADEAWMDYLATRNLLAPGTRATLAGNRLVVIAPLASHARVTARTLGAQLAAGPVSMADPTSVPAGKYGKAALEKMGAWAAVAPHVVSGDSVRAALATVERGAAPFGIVYATDAKASSRVRIAGIFPASSHPPIIYPLARLKASRNPEAEGFRRFLLSRAGKAIFARYGFTPR
jgi:molybdate transport system substrate-binding protein